MKSFTCAFTGHRPERFIFGYDETSENYLKIKTVMTEWVEALITGGVRRFYSGMALGVDQWACSIVLDMKRSISGIRLTAVVPCETQANRWSETQRKKYYDMLALCDDVVVLNKHYTRSCMFERNRYLVDHADYVLAVYDGGGSGGTAYTVNYSKQKCRQIAVIHPDTLEVTSTFDISTLRQYSS